MKILIVSATKFEIEPFVSTLGTPLNLSKHLSRYTLNQYQIDILVTGVGMVFTTFHLSAVLGHEKYNYVLNVGVAGAIDKNLKLGEIVNVTHDYLYELGAEDQNSWLSISDLNLLTPNDLPYNNSGLINTNLPELLLIKNLKQVKGQTVNNVHGSILSINILQNRSNAQIESMEGAAFLYCCMYHNLPCAQIRAISNFVEPRNKENWRMKEAIININELLMSLFAN